MKKVIISLLPLFLASFFLYSGNGLFITSAGLKLYEMNISTMLIGVVNASFFLGITIGAIFSIKVLQRVGHIRSFCFFSAIYGLGVLAHVVFDNIYLWILFRIFLGFGDSGLLMIIESWLNERSDTSFRGRVLSFYSVTFYLSYLVSTFLLSFNMSMTMILVVSSIFVILSLIPVSLTKIKEPNLPPQKRASIPNLLNIIPLALLGSFISGIVLNGFFTMGSVYILDLGFGAKEVSAFLASGIFGGFIIQIPMGKFSDTYGRRNAILLTTLLAFFSSCGLFIFVGNIYIQYIASFFLGCGIFTFYSLSLARANDVLEDASQIVEVNRGLLFSYGIGSLIAPLLVGYLLRYFGYYGFIGVFALSSLILFLFALTKDVVPIEERSVYVPVVGDTGSIAPSMDVREENNMSEIEELHAQNSDNS